MQDQPAAFDMNAAGIRRAEADARAFLAGLAVRLEAALPGRVTVERRGLFGGRHVVRLAVAFETDIYTLALQGRSLFAERCKMVRGVALKSESMTMPDWLAALNREVARLADYNSTAQAVLHDFLMS